MSERVGGIVLANDLPYLDGEEEDPQRSLEACLAFAVDDWASSRAMAWAYGVICGWDDASMAELAPRFRWDEANCARLQRLHEKWDAIKAAQP